MLMFSKLSIEGEVHVHEDFCTVFLANSMGRADLVRNDHGLRAIRKFIARGYHRRAGRSDSGRGGGVK